jgi:hypothetical protein
MKTLLQSSLFAVSLLLFGCAVTSPPVIERPAISETNAPTSVALAPHAIRTLKLLGTTIVERRTNSVTQSFGGISGMDWDPRTQEWYLISDDRSEIAPARIYAARMEIGDVGFISIEVMREIPLKQADGSPFPSPDGFLKSHGSGEVPDAEALRIDPVNGELAWSSEGDRRLGLQPFVKRATRDGRFISAIPLPLNLRVDKEKEIGVRNNLAVEGLAFTDGGKYLWVAMESALYQDGPVSTLHTGALARFSKLSRNGDVVGQFAYPLDPIPIAPTGGKKRGDNGVSEILAIDENKLLVVERSGYEVGEMLFKFAIRIYEATADGATDISPVYSLTGARYTPMRKRLLLDLATLGLPHIDNLEAAAWGPRLPNGHSTLVLASDDNFSSNQANQFFVFEIIEP